MRLFQHDLCKDPFWMLVACCLVNRTTWKQARPVFEKIREKWPNPSAISSASRDDLYECVKSLGFGNIRSERLKKMAVTFVEVNPSTARDVLKIAGCGKYASDSWAIFVDGDLSTSPTDKELSAYLRYLSAEV